MVSQKRIKDLEFETIEDYYNYISDSVLNGQRQQAKSLIKDLSKAQKKEAITHFEDVIQTFEMFDCEHIKEAKQFIIELI